MYAEWWTLRIHAIVILHCETHRNLLSSWRYLFQPALPVMALAVPDCVHANRFTCLLVLTQCVSSIMQVMALGRWEEQVGQGWVATGFRVVTPDFLWKLLWKDECWWHVCLFSSPAMILNFDSFSCIIFLGMSLRSLVILRHSIYRDIDESLSDIAAKKVYYMDPERSAPADRRPIPSSLRGKGSCRIWCFMPSHAKSSSGTECLLDLHDRVCFRWLDPMCYSDFDPSNFNLTSSAFHYDWITTLFASGHFWIPFSDLSDTWKPAQGH